MADDQRKSKKRSGTKAEQLLETSVFFVDRCLGLGVGTALASAGLNIEIHQDHFADDAEDAVWIPAVSKKGWVVLTKDKAIRKRTPERQAVIASGGRLFTLPNGSMTGKEMQEIFLQNLLSMGRFLKNHQAPFIARVSRSGVDLLVLKDERDEA